MARIEPAMTALVVRKEYRSAHDPGLPRRVLLDAPALPQGLRADDRERSRARTSGRLTLHPQGTVLHAVRCLRHREVPVPGRAGTSAQGGCCAASGQCARRDGDRRTVPSEPAPPRASFCGTRAWPASGPPQRGRDCCAGLRAPGAEVAGRWPQGRQTRSQRSALGLPLGLGVSCEPLATGPTRARLLEGCLESLTELLNHVGQAARTRHSKVPDEGDCGDGRGRGNGRDDAGGAAQAAGSDKRRHRSDSCVGIRAD